MVTRMKDSKVSERIFTWFTWNTCHKCCKEFRREYGYKSFILPKSNNRIIDVYLCKACGASKEHADLYFLRKRKEFVDYRPPAPIAPPKKL